MLHVCRCKQCRYDQCLQQIESNDRWGRSRRQRRMNCVERGGAHDRLHVFANLTRCFQLVSAFPLGVRVRVHVYSPVRRLAARDSLAAASDAWPWNYLPWQEIKHTLMTVIVAIKETILKILNRYPVLRPPPPPLPPSFPAPTPHPPTLPSLHCPPRSVCICFMCALLTGCGRKIKMRILRMMTHAAETVEHLYLISVIKFKLVLISTSAPFLLLLLLLL